MASTGLKMLRGGVCFITGAASGIGRATAIRFAKHGVSALALGDINTKSQVDVSATIKEQYPDIEILTVPIDTTSEDTVIEAHRIVVDKFGRIDYAVNNAGVTGIMKSTPDMSSEDFKQALDVNTIGVWLGQREQIKQMMKQQPLSKTSGRGSIVNISSIYGLVCGTNTASYCASKHAVLGITRADASDFARHGIRINAVCPGYIQTPMIDESNLTQNNETRRYLETVPMGRLGTPTEIADAVIFLSSPMSTYITGSSLTVDGGFLTK